MSTKRKQAATKRVQEKEELVPSPPKPAIDENGIHHLVNEQSSKDIWMLLLVFRFINALCLRTFFQPDEYFQSLEPAWQIAFGPQAGAWITWEWQHQLRSSLHPALFAVIYTVVDGPMKFLGFFPQFRAIILSVLPNIAQAVFAANGDYYTWKLGEMVYGVGSNATLATLLMTMFSPWQWFCSTRTFSNCLETTMTITALYFWPWEITLATSSAPTSKSKIGKKAIAPVETETLPSIFESKPANSKLRLSLLLALTAIILRPTNGLIWVCIGIPTLKSLLSTTSRISLDDKVTLLGEAINCGIAIVALSAISDRLYFGFWTFPPYQWLTFNISLDLAVFYGRNDWHYYLSQGLPLLLTTYLPFGLTGLWKSIRKSGMPFLFTTTILTTLGALSLISHKEVRFIYPLLPLLHILAAPSIASFFYTTAKTTTSTYTKSPPTSSNPSKPTTTLRNKPVLTLLLLLNLAIAFYTTQVHQTGVISIMTYLRTEYESLALDARGVPLSSPNANKHISPYDMETPKSTTGFNETSTFVAFLMPCHSTPWRSKLFYADLKAWALTCEPPLDIPAHTKEREEYRDEADRFYDDPLRFLEQEVGGEGREWPRFVAGFEGIGKILELHFGEGGIKEKWRTKNSQWHDDWRRKGDVVVWEVLRSRDPELRQMIDWFEMYQFVRAKDPSFYWGGDRLGGLNRDL